MTGGKNAFRTDVSAAAADKYDTVLAAQQDVQAAVAALARLDADRAAKP